VLNKGVGFGLFEEMLPVWFWWVVVGLWVWWLFFHWGRLRRFGKVGGLLMLVGGVWNLIGRALLGGVLDYLSWGRLWFNFADVLIVLGVLGLVV